MTGPTARLPISRIAFTLDTEPLAAGVRVHNLTGASRSLMGSPLRSGSRKLLTSARSPCCVRVLARGSVPSLARVGGGCVKERLKSVWRDPDRVRYAHVVQFAALAETVHRGRGHAEPCRHLFDGEKRADPKLSHRCPDHRRTKILGMR